MPRIVVDTTVLVSAFLKPVPGGASFDLLRRVASGNCELFLSDDILEETARVLLRPGSLRRRYAYEDAAVIEYCQGLAELATIVDDVPAVTAVRDPEDDMILACAIGARADYLVSRDRDLLSLGEYGSITIVPPEALLGALRDLSDR